MPVLLVRTLACTLLICAAALTARADSLQFFGTCCNDTDRVKIAVDNPADNNPGPPADIGAGNFTIEFWLRALPGSNTDGTVSCGNTYNWINGNIIVDRDRYNQGRTYGIALGSGRIAFGTQDQSFQVQTLCGTSDVRDGVWHHVAVQRASNGQVTIFVDGQREAVGTASSQDLSYPDNGQPLPGLCAGQPCANDPYIVIGAEKHNIARPFTGWFDEFRLSTVVRYTGTSFTPPTAPFTPDASTAALYHFEEGSGNTIVDEMSNQSPGTLFPQSGRQHRSTESPFGATPAPGTLQLGAATYSVGEASASVSLSVTRTGGSSGSVTIDYDTGTQPPTSTATVGADYQNTSGTLTFAGGDTATKSFTVPINDDTTFEGNETFTVTVRNPTGGATLGTRSSAVVTIVENDPAPMPGTLALVAGPYTVAEGATSATVTVTRTGGSNGAAIVQYTTVAGTASAGSDYQTTSGTLNWPDGDNQSRTITIPIVADTTDEPDEDFEVVLSNATGATLGAPSRATVRIVDDDPPAPTGTLQLTAAAFSASEGAASMAITISRSNGSAGAASVGYATAQGSASAGVDYRTTTGTMSWLDGDSTTKTINIPIIADTLDEADEQLTLTLSGAVGATLGTPASATLTILDDDAPAPQPGTIDVTPATQDVSESATSVSVTIRRTGGSDGPASVTYATTPGSAAAGADYDAATATLTWANGDSTARTVTVTLRPDTTDEPDETFQVVLSNATGAALSSQRTATIRILDDDVAPPASPGTLAFTASSFNAAESAPGVEVTVSRTNGTNGAVSVIYATTPGTAAAGVDYQAVTGTLTWASGNSAVQTITIPILADALDESDETLTITLGPATGATLGAPATATVQIADDDPSSSGGESGGGGAVGWLGLAGLVAAWTRRRRISATTAATGGRRTATAGTR